MGLGTRCGLPVNYPLNCDGNVSPGNPLSLAIDGSICSVVAPQCIENKKSLYPV